MSDTVKRWKKKQAKRMALQANRQAAVAVDKNAIAKVVHHAVCEFHQDDGLGHCAHYAVGGAMLISALTKQIYMPQCGSLYVSGDPDDPNLCMSMQAQDGGLHAGEFHTWIVGPLDNVKPGPRQIPDEMEIVDFAARHFRRWGESARTLSDRIPVEGGQLLLFELGGPRQKYLRPDLPYIWCPWKDKPEWVGYKVDDAATNLIWSKTEDFQPFMLLVTQLYRRSRATA